MFVLLNIGFEFHDMKQLYQDYLTAIHVFGFWFALYFVSNIPHYILVHFYCYTFLHIRGPFRGLQFAIRGQA
ncbi:hypothetical protein LCGC14_1671420 [marine sediment metagenome]|uniref:Uncharacterized protein n=1 Tax=marine sediment metagenome TaxID=412755 RepID=A0A0F9K708_9ZZZZ